MPASHTSCLMPTTRQVSLARRSRASSVATRASPTSIPPPPTSWRAGARSWRRSSPQDVSKNAKTSCGGGPSPADASTRVCATPCRRSSAGDRCRQLPHRSSRGRHRPRALRRGPGAPPRSRHLGGRALGRDRLPPPLLPPQQIPALQAPLGRARVIATALLDIPGARHWIDARTL